MDLYPVVCPTLLQVGQAIRQFPVDLCHSRGGRDRIRGVATVREKNTEGRGNEHPNQEDHQDNHNYYPTPGCNSGSQRVCGGHHRLSCRSRGPGRGSGGDGGCLCRQAGGLCRPLGSSDGRLSCPLRCCSGLMGSLDSFFCRLDGTPGSILRRLDRLPGGLPGTSFPGTPRLDPSCLRGCGHPVS